MSRYMGPAPYVSRMARAELDQDGSWVVTIAGTDVRSVIRECVEFPVVDGFPGFALGHELIRQGYMPNRSDTSWHPSGWRSCGRDVWAIPCYQHE